MQVFMGSAKWLQVYFCEERVICTLGKTFAKKKKNKECGNVFFSFPNTWKKDCFCEKTLCFF